MSSKSNDQGRAYEFCYLMTLYEEIQKVRKVEIEKNSSYYSSERSWQGLSDKEKENYQKSALAGVLKIFELEPLILEDGEDKLELKLQTDEEGKRGDVRDVLIIRRNIEWEIGLSVKHNHFAVKHSRLSKTIDFGQRWYGVACSKTYWSEVAPIFTLLEQKNAQGLKWRDLTDKEENIYYPLLKAFKRELLSQNENVKNKIPRRVVEYLLGKYDFYKTIGIDKKELTQIQIFNFRGTLNKRSARREREMVLPISKLPSRIVALDFKPDSKNTLELYLDEGWQFSFRIHNASTKVEPSLKFDIQIIGMPVSVISIDCKWK